MNIFQIILLGSGWLVYGAYLIYSLKKLIKLSDENEKLRGDIQVYKHVLDRNGIEITQGIES